MQLYTDFIKTIDAGILKFRYLLTLSDQHYDARRIVLPLKTILLKGAYCTLQIRSH